MIGVHGDLSGVANYIAAVEGIFNAVHSPDYKSDFLEDMMDDVEEAFLVDTIANRHNLSHMFEWPNRQGQEPSPIPLFKIVRATEASGLRIMTYEYLPSVRSVPLPDPSRYGFKASKLKYLRRHKFTLKAIVMETQSSVVIRPKGKKALFIPDASAREGYYMTKKPVTINPGGGGSTGQFTGWWTLWFGTAAQEIINAKTQLAEETFAKNGGKAIRDATTGRFATGRKVSFAVDSAVRRRAELEFRMLEKRSRR